MGSESKRHSDTMTAKTYTETAAMAKMYLSGQYTYKQIGEKYGLTSERVRQRLQQYDPTVIQQGKQAKKREAERQREERRRLEIETRLKERPANCAVCGAITYKFQEADIHSTCSEKYCKDMLEKLGNHVGKKRLYLYPGSRAHEACHEAYRLNLPIFNLLSERVQKQIIGECKAFNEETP